MMNILLRRLCRVKTCFLIADVQAGTAIIGYLDLISGGISVVIDIAALMQFSKMELPTMESKIHFIIHLAIAIVAVSLLMTLAKIAVSITLVVGVKKNNPKCVLLWLHSSIVFILVLVLFVSITTVLTGIDSVTPSLILITLQSYYILVVNSYYSEMTQIEKEITTPHE